MGELVEGYTGEGVRGTWVMGRGTWVRGEGYTGEGVRG